MLSAIRETLPLFLQGLSIISRQSQAAYVKQQLKTTIQQYFGRFLPNAPSVSGSHPMLLALCDSVPSPHTTNLRRTVMEVVRDGYLQFKGHAPPPRLATILSFIVDVFQRTKTIDAADADTLLPSLLKCLILVNEPQVKKLSTDALQHMVEGCLAVPQGDAATRLATNLSPRSPQRRSQGCFAQRSFVTSRSHDRDVIPGPSRNASLGTEAAVCTAERREDSGPSENSLYLKI
ncbi:unnamed protein product [Ranitomeya imitator]|uniref:MMS22-like C-terminal domain-containing protein n=1 Tax=Ranitomeya imitator TaxID=111125 RepID=A0ABN9MF71_9NEOB|nr:unnamed protein product [Ranitomeya imitator]